MIAVRARVANGEIVKGNTRIFCAMKTKSSKPVKKHDIKRLAKLRDAVVSLVHQKGKWQTIMIFGKRMPIVGIKDHQGLSLIYKTPFQKSWYEGMTPRKGYYIEVIQKGRGLVFAAYWNRNAPLSVTTYHAGEWEKTLCPTSLRPSDLQKAETQLDAVA